MFDPYGPVRYTLISARLLHRSIQCCCTTGMNCNRMCRSRYHLLVHVTLTYVAYCHKNSRPDPTMSYYRLTCISQDVKGREVARS